ncbi:MAG: LysE family translocator [Proteobacteria bacterium]|nr:LysE family translocator [Pseudomonadota bacterium]MBI3500093.1 LysE family translocator [Pseudomonadota bacterium]
MPDGMGVGLFLAAALVIALTPGPGIFYVAARSMAGGRREGLASSLGTALGGLFHVLAGACGVAVLLMASAEAFALFKFLGALYLVYLGIKTWREAGAAPLAFALSATGFTRAFKEGIVVEALNPKTAAFFLAFIPQFVGLGDDGVALRFVLYGLTSVVLNTGVDVVVVLAAASFRDRLACRPGLVRRLRRGAAAILCGLGLSLAFARRPG